MPRRLRPGFGRTIRLFYGSLYIHRLSAAPIPAIAFHALLRNNSSGALAEVGTRGLVYASSSYAAGNHNAGFLDFNASNVYPLNNANRAAALSVRCVQHLQGCFSR